MAVDNGRSKPIFIAENATIRGDVLLGEYVSIWFGAVVRADKDRIIIGDRSNVQDNAVLHGDVDNYPALVGDRVTIGHSAVIHGCAIEDDCVIGIGAILLNGARIGRGSVIAAGTVVPENMEIPPGSLVMGVPAKVRRPVNEAERERFRKNYLSYLDYADQFRKEGQS